MLSQCSGKGLCANAESPTIIKRIAEVEAQTESAAARLAELEREIEAQGNVIDFAHLKATLAEFDAVWEVMWPEERVQIVRSLITTTIYEPYHGVQIALETGLART